MKGIMLGAVGIGGVGAVAMGAGGGGPDDFVRVLNKPPSAVYNAFSAIGPVGERSETVPSMASGRSAKFTQRVVKVPNEQVKYELLIDDEALLTAEVQMSPEGQGTRMAAELDFNDNLLRRLVEETGAEFPVPSFVFQDFLIDQVFAHAMGEMADRIEEGRPLLSLAETHARWGNDGNTRGQRPGTFSHQSNPVARPQMSTRPSLDPNAAARRQVAGNRPNSFD